MGLSKCVTRMTVKTQCRFQNRIYLTRHNRLTEISQERTDSLWAIIFKEHSILTANALLKKHQYPTYGREPHLYKSICKISRLIHITLFVLISYDFNKAVEQT